MSRHRKVKAMDYEDEYDDYYGEFDDDDDDFDGDAFEAQYLSSGIDLNTSDSNLSNNKSKQQKTFIESSPKVIYEQTGIDKENALSAHHNRIVGNQTGTSDPSVSNSSDCFTQSSTLNSSLTDTSLLMDSIQSELTKIAIQHLDKHQWQLPLMEMDKKFRDRTYYKHYTDSYISSLQSKLGHFIADRRLKENPMRYHLKNEMDNYSKHSRIFELLTDYYRSQGVGYFSFATPSPDEEIVIGCRLGTKVKKTAQKQNNPSEKTKAPRFEFSGANRSQSTSSKDNDKTPVASTTKKSQTPNQMNKAHPSGSRDLTVCQDHSAEQLNELAKKYQETMSIETAKLSKEQQARSRLINSLPSTAASAKPKQNPSTSLPSQEKSKPPASKGAVGTSQRQAPKQLATLTERRQMMKQALKRSAEITQQDREAFKRQATETLEEYRQLTKGAKPRVNLVVVGHVDAGKSTLVGHLLFKLGQVTGKQMHRYEVDAQRQGKASFKFAWAMDETEEERARGVTIDLALTKFETKSREIVLLDAPGHVDFIPAVISGAAQADAALLVVNAVRGEFETGFTSGGQTREHTFLVRSLGVKSLVVVVNKMDQVNWDWLRFHEIVEQLKPFLKQVGFNLKEDVEFVACSGLTGDNLVERRIIKRQKESSHPQLEGGGGNWDQMSSLLEAIDGIRPPDRMVDRPTRVCVTDVFKGMSGGVFLGAKVLAGKLESKQKLILLPPAEAVQIKQVEVRDGNKFERAFAGDIVSAVATGVDLNKFYRGCILCDPLIPCHVTNRFEARIIMFQMASAILIKGTPIELHINGTHESGEVRRLISLLNKNSGELIQKRPRCVAKNSSAIIQVKLSRAICCELYEDNKDLGRFMMRSYGKTIAAGLITKMKSVKLERSSKSKMKTK